METLPKFAQKQPAVKSAKYLPGLNGIRAIASFIIVTSHIDEFSCLFGKHEVGFNGTRFGPYAVILFFVLSGYLITYLLILEKDKNKKINFRKFYERRMLRLWPVYFLILSVIFVLMCFNGAGVIPDGRSRLPELLYYLFFIPNIPFALGATFSIITPLWSIGVDEQFYAIWPFIMNKAKNIAVALLWFIGIYLALKIGLQYGNPFCQKVSLVTAKSALDCMAIGGLGAYIILKKKSLLKYIYNKWLQAACWLVMIVSTVHGAFHVFTIVDQELYSLVFLVIIINVSTNKKTLVNLENKPLNFIGRISYGLQVYHLAIVFLLAHFVGSRFSSLSDIAHFYVVYFTTLAISIPLSYLSYEYFEKRFINMKKKLAVVPSTNNAEDNAAKITVSSADAVKVPVQPPHQLTVS